nr:uncharacterized protein LOC114819704 [Malus domestica]
MEGYLSYRFNVLPGPETCQKRLKISMDVEHAKCCVYLNIWHDVATIAPCFLNFCNGCLSEWLKRYNSSLKRSNNEVATLDSYATIQSNLVVNSGKHLRGKRARSQLDEEADNASNPCPQCGTDRENFKPTSERTISGIPTLAHENNRCEQVITEKCIAQLGRTLQDVIAEWLAKLNNGEIDRMRMPLNHAEAITFGTPTCNYCYEKLISFLFCWFRI